MWWCILLVVFSTTSATSSVADANVATVKKLFSLCDTLYGTVEEDILAKVSASMMDLYAPRINASSNPGSAKYGFALHDVTPQEMFSKMASLMVGFKLTAASSGDIASVVGSNGKKLIFGAANYMVTPGGKRVLVQADNTYAFDDAGKIVAIDQVYDTGVLSGGDDANVATVKKLFSLWEAFYGTVDEDILAKVSASMLDLYAPRINVSSNPGSAKYGFALHDVTPQEMFSKMASLMVGFKLTAVSSGDIASVVGSNGKKLMFGAANHMVTPGGKRVLVQADNTYAFDDAGKIVAMDQIYDTGVLSEGDAADRASTFLVEEFQRLQAFPLITFAVGCIAGPAMMIGAMRGWRQRTPAEGYLVCAA